jgi:hypothetical protein
MPIGQKFVHSGHPERLITFKYVGTVKCLFRSDQSLAGYLYTSFGFENFRKEIADVEANKDSEEVFFLWLSQFLLRHLKLEIRLDE